MSGDDHIELPSGAQRWVNTSGIILGALLGSALIYWGVDALTKGVHLIETPVAQTLFLAVVLTMLVAYVGLRIPVFFHRSPRLSTFCLVMLCGHVSLFFDSFAVILLLQTGIVFLPIDGVLNRYNAFVVKVSCTFAALTVGGGFYLGELWGLPWYITNGLNNPLAGLPLLLVLTPFCALLALWTAYVHPVKMEKVVLDKQQGWAALQFAFFLWVIIVTHSAVLCIGLLLLWTALKGTTIKLVKKTVHEFQDGAENAIALILIAYVVQESGLATYIQPLLVGPGIFFGSVLSSPFTGAMAPAVGTLHEFYVDISWLMLGAPALVSSSLVAIVIFTNTLDLSDMPPRLRALAVRLGGKEDGYVHEAIAYTIHVIPMLVVLGAFLYLANTTGLFLWGADVLGVEMPSAASTNH